jgi:hypothetical protein
MQADMISSGTIRPFDTDYEHDGSACQKGTGAIIPVNDFETVSMGQMERRSFYITMKPHSHTAAFAKTNGSCISKSRH